MEEIRYILTITYTSNDEKHEVGWVESKEPTKEEIYEYMRFINGKNIYKDSRVVMINYEVEKETTITEIIKEHTF